MYIILTEVLIVSKKFFTKFMFYFILCVNNETINSLVMPEFL